jgi:hypothetical protein
MWCQKMQTGSNRSRKRKRGRETETETETETSQSTEKKGMNSIGMKCIEQYTYEGKVRILQHHLHGGGGGVAKVHPLPAQQTQPGALECHCMAAEEHRVGAGAA